MALSLVQLTRWLIVRLDELKYEQKMNLFSKCKKIISVYIKPKENECCGFKSASLVYWSRKHSCCTQQFIRWLGCLSSWNNCSIKCGAVQHKGDHIVYYDNVAMEVSAGKSDTYLISISHTTGALYYSCTVSLCCVLAFVVKAQSGIDWLDSFIDPISPCKKITAISQLRQYYFKLVQFTTKNIRNRSWHGSSLLDYWKTGIVVDRWQMF